MEIKFSNLFQSQVTKGKKEKYFEKDNIYIDFDQILFPLFYINTWRTGDIGITLKISINFKFLLVWVIQIDVQNV